MRVTVNIDTESLSKDEAKELHEMVYSSGFFDLPKVISGTLPKFGTDQFSYKLEVEAEGLRHTVQVTDKEVPEALQQLLKRLTYMARHSHDS